MGGHLTNLGLSRGNAQVSGPGIASVNGVPLTRRRDHWHTGSLVSMALVALVGSGDSELTGDKLLFMAKGLLKDKTHLQVGWGIKYPKSISKCVLLASLGLG